MMIDCRRGIVCHGDFLQGAAVKIFSSNRIGLRVRSRKSLRVQSIMSVITVYSRRIAVAQGKEVIIIVVGVVFAVGAECHLVWPPEMVDEPRIEPFELAVGIGDFRHTKHRIVVVSDFQLLQSLLSARLNKMEQAHPQKTVVLIKILLLKLLA